MSSHSINVALIQLAPKLLDAEHNFATAESHIRAAARQGAQLAVLPEYHLSGWAPEYLEFLQIARLGQRYVERYQSLAKELGLCIVPGTILVADLEKKSPSNGKPIILNIAFFIDQNGSILGQYTKTNLWHPEREHLTSSIRAQNTVAISANNFTPHKPFDTPFGKVGLLICYDLCFPEAFRALVKNGAEIIIIPTFTKSDDMSSEARAYNSQGEVLFMQSALICRAFESTCSIIFCNAGGPAEEGYVGLSQVILPIVGTVSGSHIDSKSGMKIVELDTKVNLVAEDNYKIRQDLARADFHY